MILANQNKISQNGKSESGTPVKQGFLFSWPNGWEVASMWDIIGKFELYKASGERTCRNHIKVNYLDL